MLENSQSIDHNCFSITHEHKHTHTHIDMNINKLVQNTGYHSASNLLFLIIPFSLTISFIRGMFLGDISSLQRIVSWNIIDIISKDKNKYLKKICIIICKARYSLKNNLRH